MAKLDKIGGILYCIKNFIIGNAIENKEGNIYEYYLTSDKKDKDGFWVESEDKYSSTFMTHYQIRFYFITHNEDFTSISVKYVKDQKYIISSINMNEAYVTSNIDIRNSGYWFSFNYNNYNWFNKHFITLADLREKQIKSVLDD